MHRHEHFSGRFSIMYKKTRLPIVRITGMGMKCTTLCARLSASDVRSILFCKPIACKSSVFIPNKVADISFFTDPWNGYFFQVSQ